MNTHSDVEANDKLALSIRATPSAYVALAGFWFVLGILYLLVWRGGNGGAFVSITVGVLWVLWLGGFRLTVYDRSVVYRDGFYRSTRISRADISAVKNTWVGWTLLGREIRIPRMVIDYGVASHLAVNTKPFARRDIRSVIDLMQRRGP